MGSQRVRVTNSFTFTFHCRVDKAEAGDRRGPMGTLRKSGSQSQISEICDDTSWEKPHRRDDFPECVRSKSTTVEGGGRGVSTAHSPTRSGDAITQKGPSG